MNGFQLSDNDFHRLSLFVHQICGIHLHKGKRELIRARLSKRIRMLSLNGFGEYYDFLVNDRSGNERGEMLNAISTNLTSFYREPGHFKFMSEVILPRFAATDAPTLNIWSAGCSTGEEAYSILMCCLEYFHKHGARTVNILASDISTRVLDTAVAGIYPASAIHHLPVHFKKRYFQKGQHEKAHYVRVKPELRQYVKFSYINLMNPFPFKRRFDVIFCRNVMIYFQKTVQEYLVEKYYESLKPFGYLFIGHSETLMGKAHHFKYIMPTVYIKE